MGYWLGEFRRAFFAEWERSGLAAPVPDPADYAPAVAHPMPARPSARLDVDPDETAPALSDDIVEPVYGFGHDFGETCALAAGGEPGECVDLTDWCGRFNLGISLFDFVCDEMPEQRQALLAAPAFARFSGLPAMPASEIADPVVSALNSLAAGVLADLAAAIGPMNRSSRRTGIWSALGSMFAAQLELVADGATRTGDDRLRLMRLKSSEPFRVMAEFVGRGLAVPPRRLRQLANFGRVAGDCFWVHDDAADVWSDLDRGRANYFLTMALQVDPTLELTSMSPVLDARLGRIWRVAQLDEAVSRQLCRNVVTALNRLDGAPRDELSRRVATLAAQWST